MEAAAGAAAGALAGGEQRLVLEEGAVGDRVVDPGQVLLDDRPGAEVEVADLGVAHLPVGQADVATLGREPGVREALPEVVEDRGLGERDRVAGPGLGQAPAVEDDERDRGDGQRGQVAQPAASTIAAKSSGSSAAPPTRAPSISGRPSSSAALRGLDRAAVEDPQLVGRPTAPADDVADEGDRLLGLLGGRRAAGADRPDRLVGDHDPGQVGGLDRRRGRPAAGARAPPRSRRRRGPPRSRRRRGSARGPRRARPGPCGPAPRRSRRSTGAARSGRGSPPRRRARPASEPRSRR